MKRPVRISVTGAAGSISYSLLFRIASGDMLGKDQPVILQLIDLPNTMQALHGISMELEDCAFELLHSIQLFDNAKDGFQGAHYAILLGARPRGPGMERKDLLQVNAEIFTVVGRAINDYANRDVKVLVVGNPANTNCLIASRNAPDLSPTQFTALTRLDFNRLRGAVALQTGANSKDIKNAIIWGNHSTTQVPDLYHCKLHKQPALFQMDESWYKNECIQNVQKRGSQILNARGQSSAASAAKAIIDHMRDWALGTQNEDWVSMGIVSDGSYGIAKGIVYSFPVFCDYGRYEIVQGLNINEFIQEKMSLSEQELLDEKTEVERLLPKETELGHNNLSISLRSELIGEYSET